jgi:gamma-glutamylcyclotransferase (GGCT)/AIG2-like uncharacterized protein YtfP
MNLGLYGTLLDPQVRALVLGEAWQDAGRPAKLEGWGRFYVEGQKYPGIRRQAGSVIDVLVLDGVPPDALAAADAFEGDEYTREALAVVFADKSAGEGGGAAMFYVPKPSIRLSRDEWRYDAAWRGRHRAAFLKEAYDAVAGYRAVVREPRAAWLR